MQVLITGSEKNIKELIKKERLYIKRKGLTIEIVDSIVNVEDTAYKPEPLLSVGVPFDFKVEVKKTKQKK